MCWESRFNSGGEQIGSADFDWTLKVDGIFSSGWLELPFAGVLLLRH